MQHAWPLLLLLTRRPALALCRVWELGEPALAGDAPEPPRCRELRKVFGERAHSGPVVSLLCPADGQLVWSASAKGLLLWDAACGAFLGALQRRGATALSGSMSTRLASQPLPGDPLGGAGDASRFTIVGSKVGLGSVGGVQVQLLWAL